LTRTFKLRFRRFLCWVVTGLIAASVLVWALYLWDIKHAYKRIRGNSTVITSPYGDIEYTEMGSGPPVLVIHGSGGGYDQGELIVQAVLGEIFHSIIPSHFGYLRSTFHTGATWDDQSHVYKYLIDKLGIKKTAVVALSLGGPSALLFAVLYPENVSSLTLISCGVASSDTQNQEQANKKGEMWVTIFKHDSLYWAITKLFKGKLIKLMGANEEVIRGLTPEQREIINKIIDYMNPVHPRYNGAAFDNKAKMPNERIAAIKTPTLIFHAIDDTLQIYHNAEFAASTIPGAKLIRFENGGHLILGTEQTAISTILQKHILDNSVQQAGD
jgi:2-hydroxy-6-oxonona-2,4-dienedioate hydrolase